MNHKLMIDMDAKYEEYLIDESKFTGTADSISFPKSEEEVLQVIQEAKEQSQPITIQGGKTGIAGGAVPQGGHIMNLSEMNQVTEYGELDGQNKYIKVQPGITLDDLKKEAGSIFKKTPVFWPPDPTETTASIGGVVSSGARGINVSAYGPTENYILGVRFADADGTVTEITREKQPELLEQMIGSEGILGVFTEITLKFVPKPEEVWGICFFFQEREHVESFISQIEAGEKLQEAKIAAAEYIDRTAIRLIEERKDTMTKIRELPDISSETCGMVFLELHGTEEGIEKIAENLMETAMECNSDPEEAWAVSGEAEVEKLKAFRHAAAETANLYIEQSRREEPRITKLGMDIKIKSSHYLEAARKWEKEAKEAGIACSIFGHLREKNLHVNLLPDTYEQYQTGRQLIADWTEEASEDGAEAAAEHGIGKLKREIHGGIPLSPKRRQLKDMKETYDPAGLWNRGNVFPF